MEKKHHLFTYVSSTVNCLHISTDRPEQSCSVGALSRIWSCTLMADATAQIVGQLLMTNSPVVCGGHKSKTRQT